MAILHEATLHPTKLEALQEWVPRQPWCPPGTGDLSVAGRFRFDDPDGEVGIETIVLAGSGGHLLHVPLTYRGAPLDEATLVARMEHSALGTRWAYDATTDPLYLTVLAGVIAAGAHEAAQELHRADGTVVPVPPAGRAWGVPGGDAGGAPTVVRVIAGPAAEDEAGVLLATWDGQAEPVVLARLG